MKIWRIETGGKSWLWIDQDGYPYHMIKKMVIQHLHADDILEGVEYEIPDDLTITEVKPDPTYLILFEHSSHQTMKIERSIAQIEL